MNDTMTGTSTMTHAAPSHAHGGLLRSFVIALTAFLTVVDLFATQAILPSLAKSYGVTPSAIGFAVNASTIGMAIAGLAVAFFSHRIDRRKGILVSLTLLSIPTALLAVAPDLTTFALLRIAQGLLMSTAFALTLSYLAEHCSGAETAGAFAAYITGNVASNLFGRLMSAAFVDHLGLAGNFLVFAALNLAGAVLVWFTLGRTQPMPMLARTTSPFATWAEHLRDKSLRAAFVIGFLILFAFIGTFTYVNFVLVREPLSLSRMGVGFVYFVFLPSMITTPLAGRAVARLGVRPTFWGAIAVALAGLPLLLTSHLPAILTGLALIGVGTFFAQATATGFVGRAAGAGKSADRASASGIYLACYFFGGIVGSLVLGQLFDRYGWSACVAGIGLALIAAAALGFRLRLAESTTN